jgi:carboxylesterase type B
MQKPDDIESAHLPLLPVMFFIHGGAFYMGTYFGMGPKELLEKDVVLVEIQYRLGPLGFMCLDHEEIAGNMGMMDQVKD